MPRPPRARPRRTSYAEAIAWIAANDDTGWVSDAIDGVVVLSVTASMVADLFSRTDAQIVRDLKRELRRQAIKG